MLEMEVGRLEGQYNKHGVQLVTNPRSGDVVLNLLGALIN